MPNHHSDSSEDSDLGGVAIARQDTGIDALSIAAAVLVFSLFGSFLGVPMFVVGWWLQSADEAIPRT